MKKQYYWNIPDNLLNSLKQRKKLYSFYKNEQNKARELVENCQSVLFPELVASLNKIDERIKLLIFYQNLEDCELSEEEIRICARRVLKLIDKLRSSYSV